MLALALLCAAFTAATHFYIFYLELLAYGASNFRRVFQIPPEQLPIVRAPFNSLAVYNIALALSASLGILLHIVANTNYLYGMANGLIFAALGTATAAGAYLWYSQPDRQRPALIQAAPALLGLICLALSR